MRVITKLDYTLLGYLNEFRDWIYQPHVQTALNSKIKWPKNQFQNEGRPEYAASREFLNEIDASTHIGFPTDMYGIDLNYDTLKRVTVQADPEFFEEIRRINLSIDGKLQNFLGARHAALKAYYPKNGYIGWHTNWNAPGYNIIFTYSEKGDGYWRHVDPTGSKLAKADLEKIVHIPDQPGWHCKAGYFGTKAETDKIIWHSAFTSEPRLTMSYILYDKAIWDNMIEEIEGN